ncbi:hypothetical protein B0T22DRAFT_131993 [Podospora appendiculata]|uniref:Uncharacterized protein n=1 Tax=Podospora appendiculata TaxID=314037 RepID=A0AAE0X847_9PEZI|nr:hypothetical protein B0T22DRAFT_131993 [Podospora appendiculata]
MDHTMQSSVPVQGLPPPPPSFIKVDSPFSPRSRQCCQCNRLSLHQSQCEEEECAHTLCHSCPSQDARGNQVIPHSFPVSWTCSTCGSAHSVLEILTGYVDCKCQNPTLQAVYDQFGSIFLYWRDDPAVHDLTDPVKVREAAWRVWTAGSEPWLPDVVEVEQRAAKGHSRRRRPSQSSLSSEDSLDAKLASMA